jgi:mannose-6-phosphate isomerase-like protein (cupin superfamily)
MKSPLMSRRFPLSDSRNYEWRTARTTGSSVDPRLRLPGMGDTTITKVDSAFSPKGPEGEKYLASGRTISMRLWDEGPNTAKAPQLVRRDYETVGYVLEGSAELETEGQTVRLEPGNSWVVPKGAAHAYRVKEHFKALEATSPPYQVHGRDR